MFRRPSNCTRNLRKKAVRRRTKIRPERLYFRNKIIPLLSDSVSVSSAKNGIKREPGENPGQSRCCEAPQRPEHLSHWRLPQGRREGFGTGVSQKTCRIDSTSEALAGLGSDIGRQTTFYFAFTSGARHARRERHCGTCFRALLRRLHPRSGGRRHSPRRRQRGSGTEFAHERHYRMIEKARRKTRYCHNTSKEIGGTGRAFFSIRN